MKTFKVIVLICLAALTGSSCTDQRDLYVASRPMLLIQSDWAASGISTGDGATVLTFNGRNSIRNLIPNAVKQFISMDQGIYDILIFNGLMYSDTDTHLDHIRYRGTNTLESFEAYATKMENQTAFRAGTDEIVVNNPDILATQSVKAVEVAGRTEYELKYKNGKVCPPSASEYIEDTIQFYPCRITHTCQVRVHASNVKSIRIAKGSIKGFSNSAYLASRMPSHAFVTHQFSFNTIVSDKADPTAGMINSQIFNTFGPPLNLPGRKYELTLSFLLVNNEEYGPFSFDITDQVEKAIAYLKDALQKNTAITETILIRIGDIKIPKVNPENMDVGVTDWGNNVIVSAPFR